MQKERVSDNDIDKLITNLAAAEKNMRQTLAKMHRRIETVLPSVKDANKRGVLLQNLWECQVRLELRPSYFSHCGEDWWLDEHVFKGQRDGVFVDLGGYDGIHGSNTFFFELMRGWNGILVEPSPGPYAKAASFRRCPCLNLAVAKAAGEAEFLDVSGGFTMMSGLLDSFDPYVRAHLKDHPSHKETVIKVRTVILDTVLQDHGLDKIDCISMDIEGAELQVLEGFPFERYDIRSWIIENKQRSDNISKLMSRNGYKRVEMLGGDDIYLRKNEFPELPAL